jgi:hypothetical protein
MQNVPEDQAYVAEQADYYMLLTVFNPWMCSGNTFICWQVNSVS